jgi:hypothetical protein
MSSIEAGGDRDVLLLPTEVRRALRTYVTRTQIVPVRPSRGAGPAAASVPVTEAGMSMYESQRRQQQTTSTPSQEPQAPAVDHGLGGAEQWGNAAAVDSLGLGGSGAAGAEVEGAGEASEQPGWAADLDGDVGIAGAAGAQDVMWNPAVRQAVATAVQRLETDYLFALRANLEDIAQHPEDHEPGPVTGALPLSASAKVELPPELVAQLGGTPGRWIGVEIVSAGLPLHITEISPGVLWTTVSGSCADLVSTQLVDHGDRTLARWREDVGVAPFTVRSTPLGLFGVPDALVSWGPRA